MTMIFDSDNDFPNSTVEYTPFRYNFLRQLFAKLREQEALLQDTIAKGEIKDAETWPRFRDALRRSPLYYLVRATFLLEFTEGELMWMAHNVSLDCRGSETALGYIRNEEAIRNAKQLSLFSLFAEEEEDDFEEVTA